MTDEHITLTTEDFNYALVNLGGVLERLAELKDDSEKYSGPSTKDDMALDLSHVILMLALPLAFKKSLTMQTRDVFEKAITELEHQGALSINMFKNEATQAKYVKLMLDKSVKM